MKLKWLSEDFYQFANYLVQDDLQASKLIIDVAHSIIIAGNQQWLLNPKIRDNRIQIFRAIYQLVLSRLKYQANQPFQGIVKRAIIILSTYYDFEPSECSFILSIVEEQIYLETQNTRFEILESLKLSSRVNYEC